MLRIEVGGDIVFGCLEHGDGALLEDVEVIVIELDWFDKVFICNLFDEGDILWVQWLLVGFFDWHWCESLLEWWDYFNRLVKIDEELVIDAVVIGGLGLLVVLRMEKLSTVWELQFLLQDIKLGFGFQCIDPRIGTVFGIVVAADFEEGVLELRWAIRRGPPDCTSLISAASVADWHQRARLRDFGQWVLANGVDSFESMWRAVCDLLLRCLFCCDGVML